MPETPSAAPRVPVGRRAEILAGITLGALLLLLVPLFLRMPLTVDAVFYDICARHVMRGGALERDFLYLVPPAMPWAMALVRSVLGLSSEALRLADLALVAAVVILLMRLLRGMGLSRAACIWTSVVLFAFYLTATEWIHCQPDMWMLLPAVAALTLRRQLATPSWGGSILEGFLWGAGCLIKPFVALPALLVWGAGILFLRHSGPGWRGRLARDTAGLVVGGLVAFAIWQGWLLTSETWHTFWHNWNAFRKEYYGTTMGWGHRVGALLVKMSPWGLIHLAALPLSLRILAGTALRRSAVSALPLLAAGYLGWLFQATFVQAQTDYHLAPATFLAMAVVAGTIGQASAPVRRWLGLAALALAAVAVGSQSSVRLDRLAAWPLCWRTGATPELMDRLHLAPAPTWAELDSVATYLRTLGVADEDLLCYGFTTTPLLTALDVRPAGRYLYPTVMLMMFPSLRGQMLAELKAGPQRFIVTDMVELGSSPAEANAALPGQPLALPPKVPATEAARWPYSEPVVFRKGRYYVHEVENRSR